MNLNTMASNKFQSALQRLSSEPLAIAASFRIKKIMRKVAEELKDFDESKQILITNYSVKNEDGTPKVLDNGSVTLDPTSESEWKPQLTKLLEIEVELPKLKASELGEIKLSAQDLASLEEIIEEDL